MAAVQPGLSPFLATGQGRIPIDHRHDPVTVTPTEGAELQVVELGPAC